VDNFAKEFAVRAHGEQKRKYNDNPYWYHLMAVADYVESRFEDPDMVDAAWLHDVLEDTPVKEDQLRMFFNERTCNLVVELTDHYTPTRYPQFNRAQRKMLEAWRVGLCSIESKWIKLGDMRDNSENILRYDPGFGKTYRKEILMKLYAIELYTPVERFAGEFEEEVIMIRAMLQD
jgi:guanosine-3',5'-bis(diphosphate) 3'-pyrophosphohydrolase